MSTATAWAISNSDGVGVNYYSDMLSTHIERDGFWVYVAVFFGGTDDVVGTQVRVLLIPASFVPFLNFLFTLI